MKTNGSDIVVTEVYDFQGVETVEESILKLSDAVLVYPQPTQCCHVGEAVVW